MTRALALICCAVSVLLSHTALAKPKVALTQIEGDASGDVRSAVVEALEGKELSLIGSREVNRAVDKLGDLAELTEKDFKKLANELEADAVVAGKLDKVGSAKTLKFRLFVHKKMAKGFTVSFKDAKSEKFRSMVHNKMLEKVGISGDAASEDDEARPTKKKTADDDENPLATKKDKKDKKTKAAKADEEDARPAKKTKAEAAEEEERPAKKTKAAKAEAAEDEERPAKKTKTAKAEAAEDEERPAKKAKADEAKPAEDEAPARKADDDEEAPRRGKKKVAAADDGDEIEGRLTNTASPPSPRGANMAPVRLDIGGSVVQHTFKFNAAKGLADPPKNVKISPVPGARLAGELYPLAMSGSRGVLSSLGVGFDYDKTLSLNLTARNPNTGGMSYPVKGKQSHWSIGVRYRLGFGSSETSPTLTLGVGYGKRLFSTDLGQVMDEVAREAVLRDTPETNYSIIDPGGTFRLPVTRMVAFSVGGRALIVTAAGPIQGAGSYGRARVFGGEGIAAVDVVLTRHFALRIAGEFTQIAYNFSGGGRLANTLDVNDPATKDVGGLADRSIGGAATLAVMY